MIYRFTYSALWVGMLMHTGLSVHAAPVDPASVSALNDGFRTTIAPFLQSFCLDCHGESDPEAKLDLSVYRAANAVAKHHQTWATVLERLESEEMPPKDSTPQPTRKQRQKVIEWIHLAREFEATRNAGDPGPVLARRLSNAEYNYSIRDLTGVDIRPTKTFPVDPANEAGFDNSGESLTMSPALLKKYLDAARQVSEHLVLTPDGIDFAPHPVMTDTDRDKYCVKRIVQFYQRQPTDLADYFLAAWDLRLQMTGARSGDDPETLLAAGTVRKLAAMLREEGLDVREEPYSISQWREEAESGELLETLACGTAAVVPCPPPAVLPPSPPPPSPSPPSPLPPLRPPSIQPPPSGATAAGTFGNRRPVL